MRREARSFVLQNDFAFLVQLVFNKLRGGMEGQETGYVFVLRERLTVSQINNKDTEDDVVVPRCEGVA